MNRKEYLECIEKEIYEPYRNSKNRLTVFDKMWCRYLNPELNAVYLIRRKQFLESRGRLGKLFSRFCHVVLMRRYGIHITQGTVIGKGLRIAHPTSIVVTHCEIGENFTIYQNCTIGQKKWKSGEYPTLGNHVTMYAGSCIIGAVKVADDVVLGANSILLQDADQAGVYVGTPARRIEG